MKVSDEVKFLEEAFDVLNQRYFESALQKVAITIQSTPKAHGHFTPWDSWAEGSITMKEINLGAESLKRPVPEIVATLLHEMVHYYCHVNGIQDTSNTYHNKRFKEECEKCDLVISQARVIGYSVTKPSESLYHFVSEQGWNDRIKLFRERKSPCKGGSADGGKSSADQKEKQKSSTRKYICPLCGMSVRATREVRIACMECNNTQMVMVE